MKKFGIMIMMLLGVVFTTTLKAQSVDDVLTTKSVDLDSLFVNHPYSYAHVQSDPWAKTKLMILDYETFNRVWDYQRKQTKEMCWGLGIGGLGVAGMIYSVNMPIPVRQVNNPALDAEADKAQRDRRIVGVSSIVVGTVGALLFADSFKWTRRIKADVGLQSARLQYNLTGERTYFDGNKKNKRIKSVGLYPRYRH